MPQRLMLESLARLEEESGYTFQRPELLSVALTHRSAVSRAGENNEKLEFLGDAVLGLAVSDVLMHRFPRADEGELSKLRAALVNARVLAAKASEIGLGSYLRLGKGEEKSGGRSKESILAAAYEALLGAVYLDGGFDAARAIVGRHFEAGLESSAHERLPDYKTRLQEITQRRFRETPNYTLVRSSGPDHDKAFVSEIRVAGKLYGHGEGKSKKAAEQQAALQALVLLEKDPSDGS
jgi:ribonuclease-3